MSRHKDQDEQSSGRTANGAVPPWKNERKAKTNTATGRKPQAGQSTENSGMSSQGLAKTKS